MEAVQLHNKEEEIIGTVLIKDDADFNQITDAWDKYLAELEDENEADIYDFVSNNWGICEVLNLEFYQP